LKSEGGEDRDVVGLGLRGPFDDHRDVLFASIALKGSMSPSSEPGSPRHFAWTQRTLTDLQTTMHRRPDSVPESELPKPLPIREFAERALQIFDRLDVNDNGRISQVELAKSIPNAGFSGKDAQVLAALYRNVVDQSSKTVVPDKLGNEFGVSRADLQSLIDRADSGINDDLRRSLAKTMQEVAESQAILHPSLYHNRENPRASINPLAVRQGTINDCYFEAALSTLAASDPAAIQQMIKEEPDGTFTVTFPGDRSNPVNVGPQTEAESGLYNHATRFGMWAGVMEKAYGEYLRRSDNLNFVMAPQDRLNNGTETAAMKLLTGNDAKFFPEKRDLDKVLIDRNVSQDVLATRIMDALRERMPLAAATPHNFPVGADKDWTGDHAHAVLAFDRNGKNGGTVLLYDPVGSVRTISLSRFMQTFSDITIGSNQPLTGVCRFGKVQVSCE
jgi:hypothetical protein